MWWASERDRNSCLDHGWFDSSVVSEPCAVRSRYGKGPFSSRTLGMVENHLCPNSRVKLPSSTVMFNKSMTGLSGFPGENFGNNQELVGINEGNGFWSVWIASSAKDPAGNECAALELIDRSRQEQTETWYYRDYLPCKRDRSVCTPASLKVRELQEKHAPWQVATVVTSTADGNS